jgi:DNA (cytosine-5)-methyltransferase 1
MNHKEKLLEIYETSISFRSDLLFERTRKNLEFLRDIIESQKGVYTVLITLGVHKLLFPKQDIRYHQDNMEGGFSGRSVDTKYITPTMKELKLTSMSESGWLTRSLEQPYPYNDQYNGKIGGNSKVKSVFLELVHDIQFSDPSQLRQILENLLFFGREIRDKNKVEVVKIEDSDRLTITEVIKLLEIYFERNYKISGGSKLPVLTFYSIYSILCQELKRFEGCSLGQLGSHTSSDRTSKSSGDIEVFKDGKIIESLEIKYSIDIDKHIVNRVYEKIVRYNPQRYYILTTGTIKKEDYDEIMILVEEIRDIHGCQLIINGLLPSLKYYLRLINDVSELINKLSDNIVEDKELKIIHKEVWKNLIDDLRK